jgi:hypothetical protein
MATDIELALMAGRAYQTTRKEKNLFPTPDGLNENMRMVPGFQDDKRGS